MPKITADAWYSNGQVHIKSATHKVVVDVSAGDLINMRAGYSAKVEVEVKELEPEPEATPEVPVVTPEPKIGILESAKTAIFGGDK